MSIAAIYAFVLHGQDLENSNLCRLAANLRMTIVGLWTVRLKPQRTVLRIIDYKISPVTHR
jgi:hypothetical protein